MEKSIAGEIIVFPAADRTQEPAAGIPVGGFITGRSSGADDPAVPVTVSDLSTVIGGAAGNAAMRIPVGGVTATL